MKINKYLILILILAASLRLYHLGTTPPSLSPDEASLGYNAYSILKTGRDEYGQFMPIILKSFGDYKPGLYVYLTIPFVALLGLTEIAVRLPAALSGVLAVYLIYLITKKWFSEKTALISALVLSLLPWHIYFSHAAWEVNVALTFTLAGIYFYQLALKKQKWLIISAVSFGLTLVTYQGAKMSSVIILLLLLALYPETIFKNKKYSLASAILGLLISLPVLLSVFTGQASRLRVFSVFSYPRPEESLQQFLAEGNETKNSLTYMLFHTESLNFIRGIMGRWYNHFSPRFLFFEGDWQNLKHGAPNQGVLLWVEAVFLIFGFIAIFKKKVDKPGLLVLLWLVLAPLPAVFSRDQVHSVRALPMLIPLTIIISLGINYYYQQFVNSKNKTICFSSLIFALAGTFISIVYFLDAYFVHVSEHNSQLWNYGYKQAVQTVNVNIDKYDHIIIQQSYDQPYIYFLFYLKYDPATYQQEAKLIAGDTEGDVGKVEHLGDKIVFGPVDWTVKRGDSGTLFVADTIRIPVEDSVDPAQFDTLNTIKYLNGFTAFRVIGIK